MFFPSQSQILKNGGEKKASKEEKSLRNVDVS